MVMSLLLRYTSPSRDVQDLSLLLLTPTSCDIRHAVLGPHLPTLSYLRILWVYSPPHSPSMASSSVELWNMLFHDMGLPRKSQSIRKLDRVGRQCYQLGTMVVRNFHSNSDWCLCCCTCVLYVYSKTALPNRECAGGVSDAR